MQFDPALKELVLRLTGLAWDHPEQTSELELPVAARLHHPHAEIPGMRVVARFGSVVTGRVALRRLPEVRAHRDVASLKASRPLAPALHTSTAEIGAVVTHQPAAQGGVDVTGRGVLLVVVDWHCDFAHANFRHDDGTTRLDFLWDQRGRVEARSPEPFGYGRVLERFDIDAALDSADPYYALGYDPAIVDRRGRGSHGTHVLDIAAGSGRAPGSAPGVAPEASLGFIHLRGSDVRPEHNLGDSVRLLEAVRFAFDRRPDGPVCVNLSMGAHGGPHDGSTLAESALDHIVAERPGRAITMSTGNYFEGGTHARGSIAEGQILEIPWGIARRRRRPAELELWYSSDDVLGVTLLDPAGRVALEVPLGSERRAAVAGRTIATAYHRAFDPNNGDHMVDLFVWPDASPGTWRVQLHGARVDRGDFHAWVEREDRDAQTRLGGRLVAPTTTTGTICNGRHTIAVGAYDARRADRPVVGFSSAGPTRDGRRKPDLSAPGAGIVAARSTFVDRAGVRHGDLVTTKSGTSMAAPHVCGTIALMFEAAEEPLPIERTRDLLFGSLRLPPTDRPVPRLRYGRGLLDTEAAVRAALRHRSLP